VANGSIQQWLSNFAAKIRGHDNALAQQGQALQSLQAQVADLASAPSSVQQQIDALPGRRIESFLTGEVAFDITALNTRGTPIIITVSQDGPFVMTHYPVVMWRPSAPANTTNLGRWRPVASYPLPTQQVTADFIDISYEIQDGGNQRNFQNAPRSPLLSRPDALLPCAVPTLWAPNSTLVFTPTYNAITFSAATPPTQGILHVDFVGYRITNL
jgi:hypothetical protein